MKYKKGVIFRRAAIKGNILGTRGFVLYKIISTKSYDVGTINMSVEILHEGHYPSAYWIWAYKKNNSKYFRDTSLDEMEGKEYKKMRDLAILGML